MSNDKIRVWTGWFNVASIAACLFLGKDVMGACITALSSFGTDMPDGSQS